MGKRLTLILVSALIVGLAMPAYAEVQNIKVSGDILVQGVVRQNMDLRTGDNEVGSENKIDDQINAFLSTVRLRVDADLTENVSAVVRLINERVWSEKIESDTANDASDTEIELDLAYMTLREFLYEPLTLIIGRQNLRYGTGFVVGDPDTNQFSEYNHYSGVQLDTLIPEDLSSMKAFDAIRAILNYDPMVIDLIFAKIDEGTVLGSVSDLVNPDTSTPENDDVDLWGINVAYDWGGDKNLASETYVFWKEVSSGGGAGGQAGGTGAVQDDDHDTTITIGTLAHLQPLERLYLSGEVAVQLGTRTVAQGTTRDRKAIAYQLISQYALDMKYSPVLIGKFTHYSGDKSPGITDQSTFDAWDPMFEDQSGGKLYNALFSATNCNVVELGTELTPLEDVKLGIAWTLLWTDVEFDDDAGTTTWTPNDYATSYAMIDGRKELGQEIDVTLSYDYTEDVQFGLNTGWFMPGDAFAKSNREDAFQCIGSVKVDF